MTGNAPSMRERYRRIAPFYDLLDVAFEYRRYRRIRPLLFEGLSGRILDAGVGTGRNMPWYPAGSEVVGVDSSPAMLQRAALRCAASPARVALAEMDIIRLALPDAAFDAATASFVFCALPDALHEPVLRELARVVKPGGSIRLLDYVRPRHGLRRWTTKVWQPWVHWAYGASFDRDPEQHLSAAGLSRVAARFVVDDLIRLIEAARPG
jgi:ubiquinone/menaquinone biosynthesis C-methylase UbiE